MNYNYKLPDGAVPPLHHHQPPQHQQNNSTLSYFRQQAIRVSGGYVAPDHGNTLDRFQFPPADMREAIRREIEKERIREEILAEEIALRRMVEYEVRRQLIKHSEEGYSSFSSPLPLLKQHSGAMPIEERIARSFEGRRIGMGIPVAGLGGGNEIRKHAVIPFEERMSEIPFQHRSVEPKNSELQPSSEPRKVKETIILPGKPSSSLSGAKRKTVTLPEEFASKIASHSVPKKDDWSCAICQIFSTSERALNDHLQGKKHKSKEAALKSQRNEKNYSIGLFPKKAKTVNFVELLPVKGSSPIIPEKEGAKDDDLKKNPNPTQKKKKKKFKFWCESCKIGATSEKSMEEHRIGKKHLNRMREINGCGSTASTQTINELQEDVKQGETQATGDVVKFVNTINPIVMEREASSDF